MHLRSSNCDESESTFLNWIKEVGLEVKDRCMVAGTTNQELAARIPCFARASD